MSAPVELRDFLGVGAVFASEAMRRVLTLTEKVAPSNATILITGESGSGKEVIARAVHQLSTRRARAWVDVNCAAIPDNLMESELFGHEKGAFSGADATKPGLFELANGGTLFLDEIGDLDARLQVKLLRVLDGAPYYRLGGVRKVSVDVRLVAATNCDLKLAVEEGRVRSDLYHRLSQVKVCIPPLRQRRDDILPLAHHFLAREKPGLRFSLEAVDRLYAYSWPGNVRELRNAVLRSAIMCSGGEIQARDLPEEVLETSPDSSPAEPGNLDAMERTAISKALEQYEGHQGKSALCLGISKRTLQRKIKAYGLMSARTLARIS